MKYSIDRNSDGFITFECLNGGIGSKKPRPVRDSKRTDVMTLLDILYGHKYLEFTIKMNGEELSQKEWNKLWNEDDFDGSGLQIAIRSDLDVLTLCGKAWLAIKNQLAHSKASSSQRYSKPKSRKAVQESWLYQHGAEVAQVQ